MRWPGADSLALAMAVAAVVVITWPRRAGHRERPSSPSSSPLRRPALPAADGSGPSPADRQIVVGNVPQEPPGFQSRAGLLARLDRAGGQVSVIHAVTGMPGVGTTQLAAAYARARLAAGWRLVAWVDAADRGVLLAGLARVAEALGLADDPGGGAGQAVRHWLEADGRRCLVVFDNAADPGGIRPFLPAGGSARVLITSNQRPVAGLGASVGVGVFCPDEALTFLAGRTGLADPEGAFALARELGYHPLALAVAASAIATQRLAYATYLSRLRAMPVFEHVARKDRPSFPCGAARAILLSLDTVRTGDRAGVCSGIMEITAVLSAVGVRRGLLRDAGRAGVLATGLHRTEVSAGLVNKALAALAERSLVSFSLDGETVTVHGLVTRVVQDGMARWNRFGTVCRDAAAVLDKRARALVTSTDRLAVRDIAEQVTALQETMTGSVCRADDAMARMMLRLRSWALYHLTVLGDSAEQAILTGRPVTADLELTLGADHPDTLAAWSNLALACQDAGRAGEAIPLHERALAGRERVLGAGHPDTLASRSNLALACQDDGRAAEAVPLFEQVVAGREWVLGGDHPDTLAARGNLAVAYQEVGRAAEAIPLFEQALRDRERVLGADDPDTLAARSNLALAYQDAGRVAEAVPLFERALAGRECVLGADHPRTLASRHNLAIAYQKEGRSGEAIALLEQTLAAHARSLGPGHPRTVASRASLASAYREAGL